MKKYKFEFDYTLSDCVMIVLHCVLVCAVILLATSFISGLIMVMFGSWAIIVTSLGYFISVIYTVIYVIRYVLEGTTIIEIDNNKE
ncbi:hypothetical protein [Fusobacterium hominis]|uniref:hypothetical protein n=1 Tax=Fusobacterium hominis TaxID=2764326 RepID=UPI0022E78532|nr:hypothetical protein [Fusobacterium hominis]